MYILDILLFFIQLETLSKNRKWRGKWRQNKMGKYNAIISATHLVTVGNYIWNAPSGFVSFDEGFDVNKGEIPQRLSGRQFKA